MKFFTYGMLKSDQPKSWMIPFATSKSYILYGYKMYMRKDSKAGMKIGDIGDYVVGEIREVKWAKWPLSWLLLWFLDVNEGTPWGVYKRIKIIDCLTAGLLVVGKPVHMWTYLYEKSTEGCPVINLWRIKCGVEL